MTPEKEFNQAVWWTLKEIKLNSLSSPSTQKLYLGIKRVEGNGNPTIDNQKRAIEFLIGQKAINGQWKYPYGMDPTRTALRFEPIGFVLEILQPKFDKFCKLYEKFDEQVNASKKETPKEKRIKDELFELKVKDREIWVNDWLIGKPHATGCNLEFFEYVRLQALNTKINRNDLPSICGSSSLKEQVKTKSFIKILNEIGFKGEILKAFFYNRGNDTLSYRGDKITKEDLENAGIKIPLFLKELELTHLKNSPV